MGSYSSAYSKNIATDNRQAATDQAIVQRGGILGLGAPVFNLNASANSSINQKGGSLGSSRSASGGKSSGGTINLQVLDGGAIDKSFDFAAFSLSAMLENIINQGQQQAETTAYTMDTIGQAIQNASAIQASAAEAVTGDNQEFIKKAAFVAVAGALAWWVWKGKK